MCEKDKAPWLVEDLDSVLETKYPISFTGDEDIVFEQVDKAPDIDFVEDFRATVIHPDGDTMTLYFKEPGIDDGREKYHHELYNFSDTEYPNKRPR